MGEGRRDLRLEKVGSNSRNDQKTEDNRIEEDSPDKFSLEGLEDARKICE